MTERRLSISEEVYIEDAVKRSQDHELRAEQFGEAAEILKAVASVDNDSAIANRLKEFTGHTVVARELLELSALLHGQAESELRQSHLAKEGADGVSQNGFPS